MARSLRIDAPGTWHHVMNRGARRQPIVLNDEDRATFISVVASATRLGDQEVHGFCLLDNHYHLLVHTPSGDLAGFMQFIGKTYTQWFNRQHGFDGALFRGRYHSVPILHDEQLLVTSRYIHRNALDAGFEIAEYPWSSMRSFIYPGLRPDWLSTGQLIDLAGGSWSYRRFVEDEFANAA